MKKFIYLFLLLTASVTVVSAQKLIPRAGVTIASNSFDGAGIDGDYDTKSITGFTVGVGYNFSISPVFSIQPELNFIQKGSQQEVSFEFIEDGFNYSINSKAKSTINYLEVPVLARAEFGSEKTKFFVQAGPSIAYGLGGKSKLTFTLDDGEDRYTESESGKVKFGDQPEDYDGPDAYIDNRLDFGVQVGAGVTFLEKISLDLRYGLGLSDLDDDSASKNRAIQFTVAVPLALK